MKSMRKIKQGNEIECDRAEQGRSIWKESFKFKRPETKSKLNL
jgi:hypothetical protein